MVIAARSDLRKDPSRRASGPPGKTMFPTSIFGGKKEGEGKRAPGIGCGGRRVDGRRRGRSDATETGGFGAAGEERRAEPTGKAVGRGES